MSQLNSEISQYVESRIAEFSQIADQRKQELLKISQYIETQLRIGTTADLIFICTHNSRRSHLAQIWTQTAAYYYDVNNVQTYSGGTEATAFNPRAVNAMHRAGFLIDKRDNSDNPLYMVQFSVDGPEIHAFSKTYEDEFNPQKDFCAVMTCSQADEACPVVLGASQRVSITYEDPKDFDGTPQEAEMYDERCQQISREMFYLISKVNQ
jgi:protein-tyrosine-phosphatase